MNLKLYLVFFSFLLIVRLGHSQGTFIYDQQSINLIEGSADLKLSQPLGQSFIPALSFIGFIELNLYDGDIFHSSGATVFVNLRSDSISGTIIGTSAALFLPDGFFDITNFLFSTPIAVLPGATYYLQPVIQSGDDMGTKITDGSYSGGSEIYQGTPFPGQNLWFREGIVVPEPSSTWLALLGSGAWLFLRRQRTG